MHSIYGNLQRQISRRILPPGAALLLCAATAWGQSPSAWTIDTFAGTLPDPDGRAIEAFLDQPSDVAVDTEGNILVADDGFGSPWVRKVSPDGRISLFAGSGEPGYAGDGGPATEAKLERGNSIAVDPNTGDVYVADDRYVRRVSADGSISTFAGSASFRPSDRIPTPLGAPKLSFPLGRISIIEYDPWNNRLYVVADRTWIWRIEKGRVFYHAGGEGNEYAGDGERPSRARFSLVSDVAVAPDGALYIADRFNDHIRRVDRDGLSITTVLGTGTPNSRPIPAGSPVSGTSIGPPDALAFDAEGRLHYADFYGRVYRVTEDGERIDPVVDIRMIAGRFLQFDAMAVQPDGTILVTSIGGARAEILAWSTEGGLRTIAGGSTRRGDYGRALDAGLHSPTDVAFDGGGRLLIADAGNLLVRAVSTTNYVSSLAEEGLITRLESDRSGGIVFSEFSAVHRASAGGSIDTLIRVARAARTRIRLRSLAVDPAGRVHVVDERSRRIYSLQPDGPPTVAAGNGGRRHSGDGGPAVEAGFSSVEDIAFDDFGNLYVAEAIARRIRRIDAATGVIETVLEGVRFPWRGDSDDPSVNADLLRPNHIAFGPGPDLELFLSSRFVNQIQRVYMPEGADASQGIREGAIVETIAGTGAPGFSGDGGPASEARLWWPGGMAFGPDGRLYVADSNNHRIRVLTRQPTEP